MPANLENSAVAAGLEKVSFHSNPKERQCQGMFKLPHNCTHLTFLQSNVQNSPSEASTVHELWISRCWHPGGSEVKASASNAGETRVQSLGWEDPLEKEMAIHSSILAWKSHGWRSLVGYSPRGHKESDTTERLHLTSPDVQVGFRKGRGTRDQIANICWIIEKAREFPKKHLVLFYWLCQSLWQCGSQ